MLPTSLCKSLPMYFDVTPKYLSCFPGEESTKGQKSGLYNVQGPAEVHPIMGSTQRRLVLNHDVHAFVKNYLVELKRKESQQCVSLTL